ncbi:MAG: ferritin [Candidatus Eisenbacteria bacterium]|nr:ferritin [Candidatus Eisenbacteria bacterium]
MLKKKMEKALNDQVNMELESAYLYLSMSVDFAAKNLNGAAAWMRMQAQEEVGHGLKIQNYILERGGTATLQAISAPQATWKTPLAAFQDAYLHEQKVTASIDKLVNLAVVEKDHATQAMLQWFVTEQVEEEASVDEVVQMLKMVGANTNGLFMIDRQLAARGAA